MPRLELFDDIESWTHAIVAAIGDALYPRRPATLAFPGGATPRRFLPTVARANFDWRRVRVTVTDERIVPPADPRSNVSQLRTLLLNHVDPSLALIAPPTSQAGLAAAANIRLDLAVVGMGEDGHIASLFPGDPCVTSDDGSWVWIARPDPEPDRVSLTLGALASATCVVLVASGAEKRRVIERVLSGAAEDLPVARLLARAACRPRILWAP